MKKFLSIVLCFAVIFSSCAVMANASLTGKITESYESRTAFGNKINDIIQSIVKGICKIYPNPRSWKALEDFDYDENFVYTEKSGRQTELSEPVQGAKWSFGYASGSIIPSDMEEGKYYMGRQLNISSTTSHAKASGVLDDQRVRVVCIDDGSGKGAVVMAVVDGLGVGSGVIRKIREAVSSYTESGKIAAVNVSATHCHSALDTQGVSTSFLKVLFSNIFTNILGLDRAETENDAFRDNIVCVTAEKIKEAYENMATGTLYYDSAKMGSVAADKRGYIDPEDNADIGILRFEPDDENIKGTYMVSLACHPTIVSASAEMVSADYIYYFDKTIQKAGYNFIMYQGAVGQVSRYDTVDTAQYNVISTEEKIKERVGEEVFEKSNCAYADAFGEKLASIILAAKSDDSYAKEEILKPYINTRYSSIIFTASNYTLHLACQCRLVDNEVCTTGKGLDDVCIPSEIGYIELGGKMAFGLFPCELYPEVFAGEEVITVNKQGYSWDGNGWDYPAAQQMVKEGIDLYCICFANDYIGYVVPDNFYSGWGHWALKHSDEATAPTEYDSSASIFDYAFRGTADQLLSADKTCASKIMEAFQNLVK